MRKFIFLFFVLLQFLSCKKQESQNHLAVTSSLLPVFQELTAVFNNKNAIEISLISSSSGVLSSQIVNGAPFDAFFSADDKYCQFVKNSLKLAQSSQTLVTGDLIMIKNKQLLKNKSWNETTSIAIANPKLAPYGNLAERYLKKQVDYKTLSQKLVYGQNVNQVLQYVLTESVAVAFLSKATVSNTNLDRSKFEIEEITDPKLETIKHTFLVIKPNEALNQFINFLSSNEAKDILSKYGYVPL